MSSASKRKFTKKNTYYSTEGGQALYDYIQFIVLQNFPLSIVENATFRSFSRHEEHFTEQTVREVILKLRVLVEEVVGKELRASQCGAILHGGWSWAGVHYIGVFASYLSDTAAHWAEDATCDEVAKLAFLSCSPIVSVEVSLNDEDPEAKTVNDFAISFSSKARAEEIRSIFASYGVEVSEWAVCQTVASTRVNKEVSKLLKIPHVACKSHLLNVEVNYMANGALDVERAMVFFHKIRWGCEVPPEDPASLSNIIDLRPRPYYQKRWTQSYQGNMLETMLHVLNDLIEVCDFNGSSFELEAGRFRKHLLEIKRTSKYLRRTNVSLCNCENALEMLVEDVKAGINNSESLFYRCALGKKYIAKGAAVLQDPLFESGVCKIQNGQSFSLSTAEKKACKRLRFVSQDSYTAEDEEESHAVSYEQRLERYKRRKALRNGYRNCNFILGSASVVDKLLSITENMLRDDIVEVGPLLLESILFLRMNERFWDNEMVQKAYGLTKKDKC